MGIPGNAKTRRVFFCNPKWKQFQRSTIPKGTVDTESRSTGKYGGSNRSFAQIAEEECEEFPVALIPMDAWQFTVILHKDDTHKSTWIPLQFHSGLDNYPPNSGPFMAQKNRSCTARVFFADFQMCFARRRRANFCQPFRQMGPHPPLYRGYLSDHRGAQNIVKHSISRIFYPSSL